MVEKGKKLFWCFCDIEFNFIAKTIKFQKYLLKLIVYMQTKFLSNLKFRLAEKF